MLWSGWSGNILKSKRRWGQTFRKLFTYKKNDKDGNNWNKSIKKTKQTKWSKLYALTDTHSINRIEGHGIYRWVNITNLLFTSLRQWTSVVLLAWRRSSDKWLTAPLTQTSNTHTEVCVKSHNEFILPFICSSSEALFTFCVTGGGEERWKHKSLDN